MMSTQDDRLPSRPPHDALPIRNSGTRDAEGRYGSPITVPLGPDTDHTILPVGRHDPTSHASFEPR